ncbi:MAG TPA: ribosome maturation factor RimM [Azospirillaceae bacterium]|nr:ribosome maturation factor RimM [Azospirillaceae bacterium]
MAKICVGQIVGVHGVRGLVKLISFTENPAAVVAYGPLSDEAGKRFFKVELMSTVKDHWLARIDGVADRTAAEALKGVRLHVDRSALPEPEEEEFYHADLLGLRAELVDGTALGTVLSVHDFGAGDVLELTLAPGFKDAAGKGRSGVTAIPFTRAVVPVVDVKGGRIVVDLPEGQFEEPEKEGAEEAGDER